MRAENIIPTATLLLVLWMWLYFSYHRRRTSPPPPPPPPPTPPTPADHFETVFDIEGQDVFSIERTDGRTCIGYWDKKGRAGNWWLQISDTEHNAFAYRLRKKLGRGA